MKKSDNQKTILLDHKQFVPNQLPLNVMLGRKIRHIRTALGMSQETFGFEVGLDRTYIGQIERAEKNISVKNVEKICLALGIDPKDLFDFSNL
jgi:transcriptional regulator with XRE-family HTH domain